VQTHPQPKQHENHKTHEQKQIHQPKKLLNEIHKHILIHNKIKEGKENLPGKKK